MTILKKLNPYIHAPTTTYYYVEIYSQGGDHTYNMTISINAEGGNTYIIEESDKGGVSKLLKLELDSEEQEKLEFSSQTLKKVLKSVGL